MNNDTQTGTLFVKGFTPFAQIPKWVIRHKQLSHGAKILYANIMTYADNTTKAAFPSRATLAEDMASNERSISRFLKELENAGAVTVTRRRNRRTGNFYANHYVLHFDKPWVTDDPRAVESPETGQNPRSAPEATGFPRADETPGAEYGTPRDDEYDPITILTNLTTPTSITPQIQESEDRLHLHNKLWSQTKKDSSTKPDPISQEFRQSKERQRIISHIQYMAGQRAIGATPDIIDNLADSFTHYLSNIFGTDENLDFMVYDRGWIPSSTHQNKYAAARWLNMFLYAWQADIGELTFHPIETAA